MPQSAMAQYRTSDAFVRRRDEVANVDIAVETAFEYSWSKNQ
jgi:hypothetical protein